MQKMNFEFPFQLLEPWFAVDDGVALVDELKKELRKDSILHGAEVEAIARRSDCDDVLFEIKKGMSERFAVVHLTWSGKTDSNEGWPSTTLYTDIEIWKIECMEPDHDDFTC